MVAVLDTFKALADITRLRCVVLIAGEGELCVCELTHALDISQPKVSRHLALLREAGILLGRREGLWIHYCLHPELPAWMGEIIMTTAESVAQDEPFATDYETLANMPNRPGARCCA